MGRFHFPEGTAVKLLALTRRTPYGKTSQAKCHVDRVSLETGSESNRVNTNLASPISPGHRTALESNPDGISMVLLLLQTRCPPTVISGVRAIDINAINRMLRCRTRPHIGIELLKRFPLGANDNPTAAIVLEVARVGIPTTPSHPFPDSILRSLVPAVFGAGARDAAMRASAIFQLAGVHGKAGPTTRTHCWRATLCVHRVTSGASPRTLARRGGTMLPSNYTAYQIGTVA